MSANIISVKEKARRAYAEGKRVGPIKDFGQSKKDQLKALAYQIKLEQIMINYRSGESSRLSEGSNQRSNEVELKESPKKHVEDSQTATPLSPSSEVVPNLNGSVPIHLPSDAASTPE